MAGRARGTKELDLARQDDEATAPLDLLGAQSLDVGDYFSPASSIPSYQGASAATARWHPLLAR